MGVGGMGVGGVEVRWLQQCGVGVMVLGGGVWAEGGRNYCGWVHPHVPPPQVELLRVLQRLVHLP